MTNLLLAMRMASETIDVNLEQVMTGGRDGDAVCARDLIWWIVHECERSATTVQLGEISGYSKKTVDLAYRRVRERVPFTVQRMLRYRFEEMWFGRRSLEQVDRRFPMPDLTDVYAKYRNGGISARRPT